MGEPSALNLIRGWRPCIPRIPCRHYSLISCFFLQQQTFFYYLGKYKRQLWYLAGREKELADMTHMLIGQIIATDNVFKIQGEYFYLWIFITVVAYP